MGLLLFDYGSSAIKNTVYRFIPSLEVWQEPDLLSEKRNLLEPPIQERFIILI